MYQGKEGPFSVSRPLLRGGTVEGGGGLSFLFNGFVGEAGAVAVVVHADGRFEGQFVECVHLQSMRRSCGAARGVLGVDRVHADSELDVVGVRADAVHPAGRDDAFGADQRDLPQVVCVIVGVAVFDQFRGVDEPDEFRFVFCAC